MRELSRESNARSYTERNLLRIAHFHVSRLFFRTVSTMRKFNRQRARARCTLCFHLHAFGFREDRAPVKVGGDDAPARSDIAKLKFTITSDDG